MCVQDIPYREPTEARYWFITAAFMCDWLPMPHWWEEDEGYHRFIRAILKADIEPHVLCTLPRHWAYIEDGHNAGHIISIFDALEGFRLLDWPSPRLPYTCCLDERPLAPFSFYFDHSMGAFCLLWRTYRTYLFCEDPHTCTIDDGHAWPDSSEGIAARVKSFLSTLATLETCLESCRLALTTAAGFMPALLVVSLPYWLACLRAHRIKPEGRTWHRQRRTGVRRVRRCRTSARRVTSCLKIPLSTASMTFCSP